jgi:hypothetical protein
MANSMDINTKDYLPWQIDEINRLISRGADPDSVRMILTPDLDFYQMEERAMALVIDKIPVEDILEILPSNLDALQMRARRKIYDICHCDMDVSDMLILFPDRMSWKEMEDAICEYIEDQENEIDPSELDEEEPDSDDEILESRKSSFRPNG